LFVSRAQFGEVSSVNIITDRMTGQSKGFAFVEMADAGAQQAIDKLNQTDLGGRTITVNEARPREENRPSGHHMAVFLQEVHSQHLDSEGRGNHHGKHGKYRDDAEDCGEDDEVKVVMLRGRVHDDRDQRLARTEDEYCKEYPGGDIGLPPLVVHMQVICMMIVLMKVCAAIGMHMKVRVLLAPQDTVDCPDEVREAERGEQPGNQAPPQAFKMHQFRECNSERNAHQPYDDAASDMAKPAQNGEPGGLCQ